MDLQHFSMQFDRRWILLPAFLLILASLRTGGFSPDLKGQEPGRFARFASDLASVRNALHLPGMAAAIVENGQVVWRLNLGFADLETKIPVRDDTDFCIASVSKTMAAVILMQLERQGLIHLSDPVVRYVPDSGLPGNITILQVMSHTSDGEPGEEFLYNGARYRILSQLVEKVTGQPYATVVRDRILRPARMEQTIPGLDTPGYEELKKKLAKPYRWNADSGRTEPGESPSPDVSAANGIASTAGDLARYAIALDGDALASPSARNEMFTPTRSTRGERLPYGLGWFVQDYLGEKVVWHFGQEESYASLFFRVPQRKLTLIVLANSSAMSDAFRLLDGNAARSVITVDFMRDVALSDTHLEVSAAKELEADRDLDEALASIYLGQHDKAVRFTKDAFQAGTFGTNPDVSTLYLLMRLHETSFNAATERIGAELLRQHPNLPTALFYWGTFYQQTGQPEKAIALFQRIANIHPPLRHWTAAIALLELGKWYEAGDPVKSRTYLQRVVEMNMNIDGAVDEANEILKRLPPG